MSRPGRPRLRTDAEIEAALREHGGNVKQTARALGLRSTHCVRVVAARSDLPRLPIGRPASDNPTPREREAMLLLLDLGSQIDVAQRMGVSPQCVSQLVNRARARIAAKGAQS